MSTPRTYQIRQPLMEGVDIQRWQQEVSDKFASMNIDVPLAVDGIFGEISRERSRQLMKAMGLDPKLADDGITPNIRRKIREIAESGHAARVPKNDEYRDKLRKEWGKPKPRPNVSKPVRSILGDSWDFHPGVHDGIDVITMPEAPLLAMCKSRVIDVRSGGWWGNSPTGEVWKGDGIIQLEVLETVGPFKRGYHIGYGHAEKAIVREGAVVEAGQMIGRAGFANAWHIHLMYNNGSIESGRGTLDPRAILEYTKTHG